MSNFWQVQLKELCHVNPETLGKLTNPKQRFRYIDLSSIADQKLDLCIDPAPFESLPSRAKRKAEFGDVLLGTVRPNLKNFALISSRDKDLLCSTGFAVLRSRPEVSDPQYIFHTINSDLVGRQLNALVTGSNYPAVSATQVGELLVPCPPLPEQKKIAEILSGIDKLIGIHSARKQKMSNLLVAMREEIFANENSKEISLGELCIPKQWQTISANQITKTGYPVYGANGQIGFYSEYNHKDPVLAVTCRGATCGNLNLIPGFSYVTGNSMCLDNLSKDISIQYLYHFLAWRKLNDVISGSAQPQITRTPLQAVQIILPTKQRQNEIVSMLAAIATSHDHEREVIARLENLKKAVSSDLLSGRKRVTI